MGFPSGYSMYAMLTFMFAINVKHLNTQTDGCERKPFGLIYVRFNRPRIILTAHQIYLYVLHTERQGPYAHCIPFNWWQSNNNKMYTFIWIRNGIWLVWLFHLAHLDRVNALAFEKVAAAQRSTGWKKWKTTQQKRGIWAQMKRRANGSLH